MDNSLSADISALASTDLEFGADFDTADESESSHSESDDDDTAEDTEVDLANQVDHQNLEDAATKHNENSLSPSIPPASQAPEPACHDPASLSGHIQPALSPATPLKCLRPRLVTPTSRSPTPFARGTPFGGTKHVSLREYCKQLELQNKQLEHQVNELTIQRDNAETNAILSQQQMAVYQHQINSKKASANAEGRRFAASS